MDISKLLALGALMYRLDRTPIPKRIHIANGEHDALAQEVLDLIEKRIREQNPGMSDEVCEECIINTGFTLQMMALRVGFTRGRETNWGRYALDQMYRKVSTVAVLIGSDPASKIENIFTIMRGESETGEAQDIESFMR